MAKRKLTFRVTYTLDESGWQASIADVKGCRTWGRSLSEAQRHIREALSTCVDVFPDADRVAKEAELIDDVRLPAKVRRRVERYVATKARAEAEAAALRKATRAAARALTEDAGLSLRDAGELLGLSQEGVRKVAS